MATLGRLKEAPPAAPESNGSRGIQNLGGGFKRARDAKEQVDSGQGSPKRKATGHATFDAAKHRREVDVLSSRDTNAGAELTGDSRSKEQIMELYTQLLGARVTEPERLLQTAMAAHEKEITAGRELVEVYKQKIASLQDQLQQRETMDQESTSAAVEAAVAKAREAWEQEQAQREKSLAEQHDDAMQKMRGAMGQLQSERDALLGTMQPTGPAQVASSTVASMERRLRLYEQFTALSMTVAEDGQGATGDSDEDDGAEEIIRCEARNKVTGSAVSFELEYDDEDGEWSYTPGQNAHILPSHLRDEICFPESSAPMFVTQLVSALYAVGGDASADEDNENENENEPADE